MKPEPTVRVGANECIERERCAMGDARHEIARRFVLTARELLENADARLASVTTSANDENDAIRARGEQPCRTVDERRLAQKGNTLGTLLIDGRLIDHHRDHSSTRRGATKGRKCSRFSAHQIDAEGRPRRLPDSIDALGVQRLREHGERIVTSNRTRREIPIAGVARGENDGSAIAEELVETRARRIVQMNVRERFMFAATDREEFDGALSERTIKVARRARGEGSACHLCIDMTTPNAQHTPDEEAQGSAESCAKGRGLRAEEACSHEQCAYTE